MLGIHLIMFVTVGLHLIKCWSGIIVVACLTTCESTVIVRVLVYALDLHNIGVRVALGAFGL